MKKSNFGVEIIRINNGFLIKDNDGKITAVEIIEENGDDELRATERLLWALIEFFGLMGSKYDIKNGLSLYEWLETNICLKKMKE